MTTVNDPEVALLRNALAERMIAHPAHSWSAPLLRAVIAALDLDARKSHPSMKPRTSTPTATRLHLVK
jgi:hypothetical protein